MCIRDSLEKHLLLLFGKARRRATFKRLRHSKRKLSLLCAGSDECLLRNVIETGCSITQNKEWAALLLRQFTNSCVLPNWNVV